MCWHIFSLTMSWHSTVINYGHVTEFIEDGKVVAYLQDPSGAYPEASGETETADRLYIQSLHAKGLGWLSK